MSESPSATIPPTAQPRLAAGARLQVDRVTNQPILLFPEGMLQLNPTGAAILELCDGVRTVEELVQALAQRFKADPARLMHDVSLYLQRLREKSLLQW